MKIVIQESEKIVLYLGGTLKRLLYESNLLTLTANLEYFSPVTSGYIEGKQQQLRLETVGTAKR